MKQYMTVGDTNLENFDRRVNNRLEEGWELHGSPYRNINFNYIQALVKEVPTQPEQLNG